MICDDFLDVFRAVISSLRGLYQVTLTQRSGFSNNDGLRRPIGGVLFFLFSFLLVPFQSDTWWFKVFVRGMRVLVVNAISRLSLAGWAWWHGMMDYRRQHGLWGKSFV